MKHQKSYMEIELCWDDDRKFPNRNQHNDCIGPTLGISGRIPAGRDRTTDSSDRSSGERHLSAGRSTCSEQKEAGDRR